MVVVGRVARCVHCEENVARKFVKRGLVGWVNGQFRSGSDW